MVFIGDTSDYVPLPNLRTRDLPSASDETDWPHPVESWDREYRRFRFNTTRVQRKFDTESVSGVISRLHKFSSGQLGSKVTVKD